MSLTLDSIPDRYETPAGAPASLMLRDVPRPGRRTPRPVPAGCAAGTATTAATCLCLAPEAAFSNLLGDAVLRRGLRVRTVCQGVEPLSAGEVRHAPSVPFPMVVLDRRVALLPVAGTDHRPAVLEVHHAELVTMAAAYFEQIWAAAAPSEAGISTYQRELLRLLARGATDEAAARRLGSSLRTARRAMAEVMKRLDARSRFQAGVRANARGWVGDPAPEGRRRTGM